MIGMVSPDNDNKLFPVQARNILVIQFRQVGDVLLTTPAVKALRDHYPDSRISYLTETGAAKVLQENPHIDALLVRNRKGGFREDFKLAWSLRQAHYDLVIDFFCNPRSAWMSFLTGAPYRIASYHFGRSWWYTHTPLIKAGRGYAAEDKLALLRAIGINGALVAPIMPVAEDAARYIDEFWIRAGIQPGAPIITIDPTSRRPARQWIPERYAQLADRLFEQYAAAVIFVWGPGEQEQVETIVKQAKHPHLLACPTDLRQLAALLARSDLHIGTSSAPQHIAAAVGTPSLTIMGPTTPENWIFPSPLHRVMRGNVPCLGCQKTVCETHACMTALTVQEVEEMVKQMLTCEV